MDLFLLDAIPLDTDLVSEYPELVKLGDYLFEEVEGIAKTANKYRSKEALKLILINLFKGHLVNRAVRYSRDKAYYQTGGRYGQIWFKYDRIIPIIDALKDLGYADHKDGLHYPEEDTLFQSRIWASEKLVGLFHEFHFAKIAYVDSTPPRELIQLKKYKSLGGCFEDYEDTHKTETMRANLVRYNKFIEQRAIEVYLPAEVPVNWKFLETRKGNVLSRRIEIVKFSTEADIEINTDNARLPGYGLDGITFLLVNDEDSAVAEKILDRIKSNTHKIQFSNPNQYFIHYINHLLLHHYYHTPISNNSHTISMTQSFCPDCQNNQSVNMPMTTTVEDDLEKKPLGTYGIRQLIFRSNCQYLHRVFIGGFDWGGRFYGAVHMDLPREMRQYIRINGMPTIELDYSAHHVRMLYNWVKIPYDKDPYEELCRRKDERAIYKKVLLILINAGDEKEAVQAISQELRGEGYTGEVLKHDFIRDCVNRIKEHNQPICEYLHKGWGLGLQYADSRITDEILYRMVSKGVPTLPVHDSFIAPAEQEGTLRQVMIEAYQKIMGEKFLPVIK